MRSGSLETLESATADAAAALADIGAVAVREDVNLEPAFWGQFPGNEQYVVRRALISSSNAAGFISLHGFPMGRARGNHWGDAVTRLRDDQRDALLLQLPRGRPRQFHDHRSVGIGQDGGAELPRRTGTEVHAAHHHVRQGSGFGDFRARARRPLRADHARRGDRFQSASPA